MKVQKTEEIAGAGERTTRRGCEEIEGERG